jgi:Predicted transcriptional regulators
MTPFGAAIRKLRAERGVSQKEMARAIGVSPAYLSALEHGKKSEPSWELVQRVIGYFHIIWDEAEELQRLAGLSRPRIVIATQDLSPRAVEIADRLAARFSSLGEAELDRIERVLAALPDKPASDR